MTSGLLLRCSLIKTFGCYILNVLSQMQSQPDRRRDCRAQASVVQSYSDWSMQNFVVNKEKKH